MTSQAETPDGTTAVAPGEAEFPLPVPSAAEVIAAADHAKRIHAARWTAARFAAEGESPIRAWRAELQWDVRRLLAESRDLAHLRGVTDPAARNAMRFLPDLAVSDDDIDVQLQCLSAAGGPLEQVPEAQRLGVLVELLLEHSCEPMFRNRGAFTRAQRNAITRTIARQMLAARIATAARGAFSRDQEAAVREIMRQVGLAPRVGSTPLAGREDLGLGEYTPRETKVTTAAGSSKADCVARPDAEVIVAVECKYSSSALNGHKRLVKEVCDKAAEWRKAFGDEVVHPVAVIGGVFNPEDVLTAQAKGVFVVWDHDLEPLGMYLLELLGDRARTPEPDGPAEQAALF